MATEAYYQKNIINDIEKFGGVAINGQYTKAGEADLQCGIPVKGKLLHLVVEVKTEADYKRVMSGLKLTNGEYEIVDRKKLKEHEPLQVVKLNRNRRLGGLALFAFCFSQVKEYVDANT